MAELLRVSDEILFTKGDILVPVRLFINENSEISANVVILNYNNKDITNKVLKLIYKKKLSAYGFLDNTILLIATDATYKKLKTNKGYKRLIKLNSKNSEITVLVPEYIEKLPDSKLVFEAMNIYGLLPKTLKNIELIKIFGFEPREAFWRNYNLTIHRLASFCSNTITIAKAGVGKTTTISPFDVIVGFINRPTVPSLVYNLQKNEPGLAVKYPIVAIDEILKYKPDPETRASLLQAYSGILSRGEFYRKINPHFIGFDTTELEYYILLGKPMEEQAYEIQLIDRFNVIKLGLAYEPFPLNKLKKASPKLLKFVLSMIYTVDKAVEEKNLALQTKAFLSNRGITVSYRKAYHISRYVLALSMLTYNIFEHNYWQIMEKLIEHEAFVYNALYTYIKLPDLRKLFSD